MSFAIAIVGLALLILVHEAGHFFASLAVGLRPRKFYVGFPPAIVKTKRKGIEYGIGAIPLGGFVKIPGMHRPVPPDVERRFDAAVAEDPGLAGPVARQALARGRRSRSLRSARLATRAGAERAQTLAGSTQGGREGADRAATTGSGPTRTGGRRPGSGSSPSSRARARTFCSPSSSLRCSSWP